MRFFLLLALSIGALTFTGCDNRTQEARRWDQIARDLNGKEPTQPWHEARQPWSSEQSHEGTAW
ncbi:MAG: hypothetical protein JO069_01120 [Verrucomicrobia bacterium]|nr:hypothetical protein [Verrucomicrobiota bacterium]